MTPAREIRLGSAAFLDSPQAAKLSGKRADLREMVERFLACAYDDLGKAPHLLEGEDLQEILCARLPARFGKKDALAAAVPDVLAAYLAFLGEHAVVLHAFELSRALAEHAPAFLGAVASGELSGRAPAEKRAPFVHRAEKTGRNDPCPCGSGKKFKQCCMRLSG